MQLGPMRHDAASFLQSCLFSWASKVAAIALLVLGGAVVFCKPAGAETSRGEPEVGTTVVIKRKVTGTLGSDERTLQKGFRVHRNELLHTGSQAQAELQLDDNTKLALGSDAELRLDEFVIAPEAGTKSVALKLLKGTFRFITGNNASETYKLETPTASIGVRGTVFDIYISAVGETFVLLHQGEVELCSRVNNCRRHRDIARVVRINVLGAVSDPLRWSAALVPGVGVVQAFPFVGQRLAIDPVRRLSHSAIVDPVTKGAKVIEQGGGAVGRTLKKLSPF